MTYPLIDINRPVRLTELGKLKFINKSKFNDNTLSQYVNLSKHINSPFLEINGKSFTIYGFYDINDPHPSIENIPLDEIVNTTKTEDKMIKQIDTTKPVRFRKIDNGSTFEFLMTIKNEYYPHVFKSTNGNGYENVAQYSERGECVIKNVHNQLDIENIPEDTEPPEEIFNAWRAGYICVTGFKPNEDKMWRSSQTYSDWKNKKITVEDV